MEVCFIRVIKQQNWIAFFYIPCRVTLNTAGVYRFSMQGKTLRLQIQITCDEHKVPKRLVKNALRLSFTFTLMEVKQRAKHGSTAGLANNAVN